MKPSIRTLCWQPSASSWSIVPTGCTCCVMKPASAALIGRSSAILPSAAAVWIMARHIKKGNTDSLKGLKKVLFTKPAQLVFEMDVLKSTDDELNIDFHYCPLVKAWQKAGCTDEEIATLCDIAMCGDHGIGEAYGAVLDLPKCIAKGDDICSLRYHKVKK